MDAFGKDKVVTGSDWPVCEGAMPGSHSTFLGELKRHVVASQGLEFATNLPIYRV
eukprot:COSAG01_NODE_732_length_13996_cov_33.626322_16_plen_55_part_00